MPGSFDDVVLAYDLGKLSEEEYEFLAEAVSISVPEPADVRRSIRLPAAAQTADGPFTDLPPRRGCPGAPPQLQAYGQFSATSARARSESHPQMEGFQAEDRRVPITTASSLHPAAIIYDAPGSARRVHGTSPLAEVEVGRAEGLQSGHLCCFVVTGIRQQVKMDAIWHGRPPPRRSARGPGRSAGAPARRTRCPRGQRGSSTAPARADSSPEQGPAPEPIGDAFRLNRTKITMDQISIKPANAPHWLLLTLPTHYSFFIIYRYLSQPGNDHICSRVGLRR